MRADYHVHSIFSDGADSPEEIVEAAIGAGLSVLGFSDHAWTPFDESYCIPCDRLSEYRSTVRGLAERYRGRIRVLCGIEQDYFAPLPTSEYDYVIGSVHYIKVGEHYYPVDESPEKLLAAAREGFGGDLCALVEEYYETVSQVAEKTGCDLIGHFDLIGKFNEGDRLFDSGSPRITSAWQRAADRLLETGLPFEINFGAVSRGWRSGPYPAKEIRSYLAARGARFLLSSDSHQKETLRYGFETFDASGIAILAQL